MRILLILSELLPWVFFIINPTILTLVYLPQLTYQLSSVIDVLEVFVDAEEKIGVERIMVYDGHVIW